MDTAQWPQGLGLVKPMEELVDGTTTTTIPTTISSATTMGGVGGATRAAQLVDRRTRPQREQALNCPRCNSTNTKFCYYNNYSLTQPRYFCKTCRRYWTEGGSLRNVPVGGGSRKNKRSSSSSSSSTTTTTITSSAASASTLSSSSTTTNTTSSSTGNPNPKFYPGQDLNIAFPQPPPSIPEFGDLQSMELLRSRGLSSFIPIPVSVPAASGVAYPQSFGLQDFKPPTLNFPLDAVSTGGMQGMQESSGRLLFPFEDLRQVSSANSGGEFEHSRGGQEGDHPGFWHSMLGGGGGGGSW